MGLARVARVAQREHLGRTTQAAGQAAADRLCRRLAPGGGDNRRDANQRHRARFPAGRHRVSQARVSQRATPAISAALVPSRSAELCSTSGPIRQGIRPAAASQCGEAKQAGAEQAQLPITQADEMGCLEAFSPYTLKPGLSFRPQCMLAGTINKCGYRRVDHLPRLSRKF
jgi:hypothetical protein